MVLHQPAAMSGHSSSRAAPCQEGDTSQGAPWGLSSVGRARVLKRVSALGVGLEHPFLAVGCASRFLWCDVLFVNKICFI